MNQTIRNYKDLCDEKERMKNLLVIQKEQLITDWSELKDEFKPVSHAFNVIGKFTKGDKSNPLLYTGLGIASDLILKNFVLAKTGWITRLAIPFVMKNYSSHLLHGNGKGLLSKLGKLFTKKTGPDTTIPTGERFDVSS